MGENTRANEPNAVPATTISSTGPSGAKSNGGEGLGTVKVEELVQRPKKELLTGEEVEEGVLLDREAVFELARLALDDLCETEGVPEGVAAGVL